MNNNEADMNRPALRDLAGSQSPAEMAQREGWSPEMYAITLAHHIRNPAAPGGLDAQRERLQALAGCGATADKASADTLAQHAVILEALFQRLAQEAVRAAEGRNGNTEAAARLVTVALKAQAASVQVMSALRVLREAPTTPAP